MNFVRSENGLIRTRMGLHIKKGRGAILPCGLGPVDAAGTFRRYNHLAKEGIFSKFLRFFQSNGYVGKNIQQVIILFQLDVKISKKRQ